MTAPDTLPPDLAELGELLREDPPRPDPGWARELDARAAAGFPRPPRRSPWARLKPQRRVLLPAMGFAASAALVVGIASVDLGTSADDAASGGGAGSTSAVSEDSAAPSPGDSSADTEQSAGGSELKETSRDADSTRSLSPQSRPIPPRPGGGDPKSDRRSARKQERSAALTLAARPREIENVADGILRVTDSVGGYVANSSVASGDAAGGSFELRIPTARLPRALAELSRLAHVRERTQASRDITAESVSARERLREARREREGLLRALGRATTLNETESIRARLRSVNAQISGARASVRRVANRAAFANVSVMLVADRGAGAAEEDGQWTPGDALGDAVRVLEVAAGIAVIVLALALPFGLLGGLAWVGARAAGRRRRERALDAL
jgi:hypothetical protein